MIHIIAQILNQKDVNLPKPVATNDAITHIINLVLAAMGALALLMLVIAGFRYTISQGDANAVTESKRMIVYTLVGLVVIALAATIVNFVLGRA